MRARVKDLLNYSLMDQVIPEASSCKYSGIILRNYLSWTELVNYTAKKAWKALHFTMCILKKGNSNMKSLSYTVLVRPILEYGAACWDPFRKEQINALGHVQKKVAKFTNLTNDSNWETVQHREIAYICALYKAHSGELAWKATGDTLQRPNYRSSVNHDSKIRNRRQRVDIRKYSFVNRTSQLWNKLPMNALGTSPSKPSTYRKRVRKVISEVRGIRSEE